MRIQPIFCLYAASLCQKFHDIGSVILARVGERCSALASRMHWMSTPAIKQLKLTTSVVFRFGRKAISLWFRIQDPWYRCPHCVFCNIWTISRFPPMIASAKRVPLPNKCWVNFSTMVEKQTLTTPRMPVPTSCNHERCASLPLLVYYAALTQETSHSGYVSLVYRIPPRNEV